MKITFYQFEPMNKIASAFASCTTPEHFTICLAWYQTIKKFALPAPCMRVEMHFYIRDIHNQKFRKWDFGI